MRGKECFALARFPRRITYCPSQSRTRTGPFGAASLWWGIRMIAGGQIVQQHLLLRRRHLRPPMDHLVHDGSPLLPVQPLLDDQVGTVTDLASRMEQAERLTFRRRYFPNSFSDNNRSEEHTSELQSLAYLVCRLLLEKKRKIT